MQAIWMTPKEGPCSPDELRAEGIHLSTFDATHVEASLERIKKERELPREELVFLTLDNPNHEGAIAKEADEHAHMGEEVRLVVEGAAVYEVRARDDRWMRIHVNAGELVVIPSQRYHRFLLGDRSVKCQQLFREMNALMPFYRASNDETRTV